MEENPFPGLKIDSADFLNAIEGRQICPKCQHSRKFYCYSCYLRLQGTEDRVPRVKLPVKVDVIKHIQEVDGKCTSAQAAVIASDDVTVYEYPNIPEYPDKSKVLLVFPGELSLTMEQYAQQKSHPASNGTVSDSPDAQNVSAVVKKESQPKSQTVKNKVSTEINPNIESDRSICDGKSPVRQCHHQNQNDSETFEGTVAEVNEGLAVISMSCEAPKHTVKYEQTFERVIFIDCTWFQVNKIYPDERLAGIQRIELKSQTTKFWRHQRKKPSTYLSTLEAIYYFMREYHELFELTPYNGQYDNLLFFFVFMYDKIRKRYEGTKVLKAYKHGARE